MEEILYYGKIRDGKPGQLTKNSYKIIYDKKWHYAKLKPRPKIYYKDDTYRNLVNNSASIENYFKEHDVQQISYSKFILPYIERGNIVADFGCGGGTILDLLKGISKITIAVEPFLGFKKSLEEREHKYFASLKSAHRLYKRSINLGLSIHVIEHTSNPVTYLQNIYKMLDVNGKLILFTPNLNDILLKLYPSAYKQFFFRKVHNYYFSGKSLELLGKFVGFNKVKIFYYHEFGLSNAFNWLKFSEAKGNIKYDFINEEVDKNWIKFLEDSGQAYSVGALYQK